MQESAAFFEVEMLRQPVERAGVVVFEVNWERDRRARQTKGQRAE